MSPFTAVEGHRSYVPGPPPLVAKPHFIAPPYLVPIYSDPKYFGPHVGPGHGIPGSIRHHTGLVTLTIASWLRRSKATVRSNSRHSADDVDEERRAISPTSIRLIRSRTSSRKRGGVLLLLPDDPWAIDDRLPYRFLTAFVHTGANRVACSDQPGGSCGQLVSDRAAVVTG